MNSKTVFCYLDDYHHGQIYLGSLFVQKTSGRETYSFEWSDEILSRKEHIMLDPKLHTDISGRQYAENGIFGMFSDSCPDRWGRLLMKRRESITARREGRKPHSLLESDYLLGVYDESRMGALRFRTDPKGCFLAYDSELAIPPFTELRQLQEAARNFEADTGSEETWLRLLMAPGSSLGGARPKATVRDEQGQLWIAKFPSRSDTENIGAWEMVAHDLADMCGLQVPEARALSINRDGTTFLVKRFDRIGKKRIHMASAMTMLEKTDNDHDASYLDIADWITAHCQNASGDLKELWCRIVFSIAISNTDDHLRNHGFLLKKDGWHLSPLYDVNPNPYGSNLSLGITEADSALDFSLALDCAELYQIKPKEAKTIIDNIKTIVADNWLMLAKKYKISRPAIERVRPAFTS
ncbi:MAG TPA: toxin HipA [Succinivibrionaceae bacterium]|nr:toxin HipA [Succinivibrionaceae bacterium]